MEHCLWLYIVHIFDRPWQNCSFYTWFLYDICHFQYLTQRRETNTLWLFEPGLSFFGLENMNTKYWWSRTFCDESTFRGILYGTFCWIVHTVFMWTCDSTRLGYGLLLSGRRSDYWIHQATHDYGYRYVWQFPVTLPFIVIAPFCK